MQPLAFLQDLLIVYAVAGIVVFLFHRLWLPSVVGLLVAGMVVGPYGLSLIGNAEHVDTLAEVGVVVLLFTVGLEFSLPRLVGLGRLMFRIGVPQVLACAAVGMAATWWHFADVRPAIFAGMLLAMSSTAVVFKLLTDRGELAAPQGSVAAAVLLFQDLLVIVCMVLLPLLAAQTGADTSLWESLGLGAGAVVLLLLVGRFVVPRLLFQVVRTHNRELFLIVLVLLCLGSSALTASMGWSLALGAFLAGLAMSESEYATQTLAEVLPFRDTLASLFFISVGMLLDLRFVADNLFVVAALVLTVIVVKFLAAALPTLLAGLPLRIAVLAGLALAQVGEFSFILANRGLNLGLLNREQYQTFLAAAVLSVALTPLLIGVGPRLADWFSLLPFPEWWRVGRLRTGHAESAGRRRNHVIIVGYGVNGRNLARVLRAVDIEYVVLELNPETVRQARRKDEPIVYGDGTRPTVLERAGIEASRVLVIAMSDPASSRRVVEFARLLNPELHIIVRTRHLAEVEQLRLLGANAIIPEEFETSVQIFARVLREYEVPRNLILNLIDRVRGDHYEVLRDISLPTTKVELPFDILGKLEVETCQIREGSPVRGRTLGEMNLRAATGATLVGVRRGADLLLNPGPDLRFESGDVAVLIGDRPQVERAVCLLDPLMADSGHDQGDEKMS